MPGPQGRSANGDGPPGYRRLLLLFNVILHVRPTPSCTFALLLCGPRVTVVWNAYRQRGVVSKTSSGDKRYLFFKCTRHSVVFLSPGVVSAVEWYLREEGWYFTTPVLLLVATYGVACVGCKIGSTNAGTMRTIVHKLSSCLLLCTVLRT